MGVMGMVPAAPAMCMAMGTFITPACRMATTPLSVMLSGSAFMLAAAVPTLGFATMLMLPGELTHDERARKRLLAVSIYRNEKARNLITRAMQTYYL